MELFAGVGDAAACMDMVVAEIFRTMMQCECMRCSEAGEWDELIGAMVRFSDQHDYECEFLLRPADADSLVVLLTGRVDSTVRGDVAGELCNMIAGGWMNRFGSSNSKVDLEPPVIDMLRTEDAGDGQRYILNAVYRFDGGVFLLRMQRASSLQLS